MTTTNGYQHPSWDEWALDIAHAVAKRADCTRSQVGAVILSAIWVYGIDDSVMTLNNASHVCDRLRPGPRRGHRPERKAAQ